MQHVRGHPLTFVGARQCNRSQRYDLSFRTAQSWSMQQVWVRVDLADVRDSNVYPIRGQTVLVKVPSFTAPSMGARCVMKLGSPAKLCDPTREVRRSDPRRLVRHPSVLDYTEQGVGRDDHARVAPNSSPKSSRRARRGARSPSSPTTSASDLPERAG
ncbi:hypothetical protein L1887_59230 [Cichorium endivia]|nr:hypothetical protein L1887_59230 [Cichorium endivia]